MLNNNKLCVKGDKVQLYYATKEDKKTIFDMTLEPEIASIIYGGECEIRTWDDYVDEENEFYTGKSSKDNYLLIVYDNRVIGSISHSFNDAKIKNMELDIWMNSLKYTGKGLGVDTINTLIKYLYNTYNIDTYMIRPWIKNKGAIKAYQKCGFRIVDEFNATDFYGDDVDVWGNGDYGKEETVNMIKTIRKGEKQ